MSDDDRREDAAPTLPGPPPPLPDLAAVSASIDRPRLSAPSPEEGPALRRTLAAGRPPQSPVAAVAPGGETTGESAVAQAAPVASPRAPRAGVGAWALALAIVALAASFIVGWMLPLGLVAIVLALVASRRRVEPRGVVAWALALGALSVLYSTGWLLWAAWNAGLVG